MEIRGEFPLFFCDKAAILRPEFQETLSALACEFFRFEAEATAVARARARRGETRVRISDPRVRIRAAVRATQHTATVFLIHCVNLFLSVEIEPRIVPVFANRKLRELVELVSLQFVISGTDDT